MSDNKFNNINITKSLDDDVFFYAKPLSPEKLKQPLKDKKIYVKVVFYDKDKKELLVDEPNNVKVRDVIKENKDFFQEKNFEYNQDIIISHKFNIKDFLISKGFKEKKETINKEGKFLEDVKYISCWIDANNDSEVSIEYDEEVVVEISRCHFDVEAFYLEYDKQFPDKKLTTEVKNNLSILFNGVEEFYTSYRQFECEKRNLAYVFATARLETGYTFGSVSEANWTSESYRKKYFEEMYDSILGKNQRRREIAKELGNDKKGDGVKYYGRGYCQLTGKNNYKKAGDFLGLDLINNPELAKTPISNAIKIILYGMHAGLFTSKKLSDYITDTKTDYFNARRIINGTDKATEIKGFAEKLEKCFEKGMI